MSRAKNNKSNNSRNFLKGIGSLLNILRSPYKPTLHLGLLESDQDAISSDWRAVGNDLKASLKNMNSPK